MKKNLYIISLLLGLTAFSSACNDGDTIFEVDEYTSVVYLKNNGITEVEFYNVNEDVKFTTSINKGGTNNNATGEVELVVFSEQEMDNYNKATGSAYKILPKEYYTLPSHYVFDSKEMYHSLEIVLKKNVGELNHKQNTYVLPIQLISKDCTVNKDKGQLLLKPTVITPEITLKKIGKQPAIEFAVDDVNNKTATVKIPVTLNVDNKWDFSAIFEQDEAILTSSVQQYAEVQGEKYTLLPQTSYSFNESLTFRSDELTKDLTINLDRKELGRGEYLLPVILKGCQGMPFTVSSLVCYIHLKITRELPQIALTIDQLSTNSPQKNPGNNLFSCLLDTDPSTEWQSQWWKDDGAAKPKHDPVYGVYVDINLKTPISSFMAFQYRTKSGHNCPGHIQIYVGTTSGDLELLKEYSGLPQAKDTPFKTPDLDISDKGAIKLVRIAIIKNIAGGDLKGQVWDNNNCCPNASLAEINLFGY